MDHTVSKLNKPFKAEIKIPGDKSISHRSIILGSIAEGITEVDNFLNGADCLCTKEAFEALGVKIDMDSTQTKVVINGQGISALKAPEKDIYLGNSGTAMRLLSGLFSGLPFKSTLTGDESLSKRPMKRVIEPLSHMDADIEAAGEKGTAPLKINHSNGGNSSLKGMTYHSMIASAQVKSCILLAGLNADSETIVTEPHLSRNHTELMLQGFGADLSVESNNGSQPGVSLKPLTNNLVGQKFTIAGDISSAAFFIAAGAIVPGAELLLKDVGINPTRTGILDLAKNMGVNLEITNERIEAGEPIADLIVKHSKLKAREINGSIIPRLIDEIPIIAIMAAQANGTTVIKDAEELRVKESDRIKTTVAMLKALGVKVEETPDGMVIEGKSGNEFYPITNTDGELVIDSHGDHRIAMSSAIAALHCKSPIKILQTEFVQTSFPSFFSLLQ